MNRNISINRIIKLLDQLKGSTLGGSGTQSLSGRAARSGVWIGGGFVIQRGLQFASNLILTRLLFPEAFGLMALCTVFIVGLAMFSDLGLKPAIIRDPRGNDPDFLNTAWTIQVIRGFVLFLAGCLLAYPISLIYNQAILLPLLVALSSTAAISGFGSIGLATAERDLDFKAYTFVQIAGQAIQIIIMIGLAYWLRSVWALVAGNIIGTIVIALLSHALLTGHKHRIHIEPASAMTLIHFGKWIFFSTIVTFLGSEGIRAMQAGLISPAEFGVLAIAYSIAAIPIELSMKLTSSIGLPAMSEASRMSPEKFAMVLHKFRMRVLSISLVLVALVILTSEELVTMLYDNRYHEAGTFVVAITLANAIGLIFAGYTNALLAIGKSQAYLAIMTFATAARMVGTALGFQMLGTIGMIIGFGVANLAVLIVFWPITYTIKIIDLKTDLIFLSIFLLLFSLLFFT